MGKNDSFSQRPRIAHITNHGYGGVEVPTGGAPDTGGQNVYVNAVVRAMVELGYHVTVFARGGFPFFESDTIREGIEPFGDHARYVYVPGGGDEFIRKEDIAIALDEEVDWMETFVAEEAEELGCRPWEVYELVNTHYWDAAVMGMNLVKRWSSLLARELVAELVKGVLSDKAKLALEELDTYSAVGEAPAYFVGELLYASADDMDPAAQRIQSAVLLWGEKNAAAEAAKAAQRAMMLFEGQAADLGPALTPIVAADAVGRAVAELAGLSFERELKEVDRHVWTPHSLGVLKQENYRDKPLDVRRNLKFCERRDHEAAVCEATYAFAATSTEIADRLRTHLHVPTERIFFFPPCVDRSLFKHYDEEILAESYSYLADKTGIDVDKLKSSLLIYETSRMDRTKRKDLLLKAFAKVAREVPDTYLLIGGGPENAVFKELEEIREGDEVLKQRAFLLGFVPNANMYPLFDLADLFVSASEMEGFGMSVAQAAAVGTPLIASHLIPFAVQYVPDDALIVRAGDIDGFAEAMIRLLRDEKDRKRRGKRLEEKTTELDWVVQSEAFIDYLNRKGFDIEKPRRNS